MKKHQLWYHRDIFKNAKHFFRRSSLSFNVLPKFLFLLVGHLRTHTHTHTQQFVWDFFKIKWTVKVEYLFFHIHFFKTTHKSLSLSLPVKICFTVCISVFNSFSILGFLTMSICQFLFSLSLSITIFLYLFFFFLFSFHLSINIYLSQSEKHVHLFFSPRIDVNIFGSFTYSIILNNASLDQFSGFHFFMRILFIQLFL